MTIIVSNFTYNHASGKMTCHHLSIIYSTLYPARTKHDNLGMRLGMDITDLEALSISNVDEAFSEMLTAVLSKGVTQGKLADALKSPIVSYSYLGEKVLHEKFSNAAQGMLQQFLTILLNNKVQ